MLYLIRPEAANAPTLWLEVTVLNQMDSIQPARLVHLRDVTAQMSTQRDMWTFHSMVMHKLNTPLHTMIGSLELLLPASIDDLSKEDVGELAGLAVTGVQRLNGAINDILQYVKTPMTGYTTDGFATKELPAIIKRISKELGLAQVRITDNIQGNNVMTLSQRAVECIVWEVLENARKFHPQESPIPFGSLWQICQS